MKVVILVDSSKNKFNEMVEAVSNKKIFLIDTENCDTTHEYKYILDAIEEFALSGNEILLGKYSGREDIIRALGDERPEMIVAISSSKKNKHYTRDPLATFSNLITLFEKETTPA